MDEAPPGDTPPAPDAVAASELTMPQTLAIWALIIGVVYFLYSRQQQTAGVSAGGTTSGPSAGAATLGSGGGGGAAAAAGGGGGGGAAGAAESGDAADRARAARLARFSAVRHTMPPRCAARCVATHAAVLQCPCYRWFCSPSARFPVSCER
jgi:hypothetical protein